MRTRRWLGWTGAVTIVAGVTAMAGCTAPGPPSGAPADAAVWADVPTAAPPTAVTDGGCGVAGATGDGRVASKAPLVRVDPTPHGVVGVWLPGLNQRPCEAVLTRSGMDVATRLAADIAAAPAMSPGRYVCPHDDASAVELTFTYIWFGGPDPHPGMGERATVKLSGCASITAPGRSARRLTDELRADLAAIAPPGSFHDETG
jgi:hypothetical protein